jgi:dTDP-4-dehydrorhamnose reductase
MVADRVTPGTYHVVNGGVCSWAELAAEALQIRGSGTRVVPIRASEWPSPTRRPAYSALRSRWLEFQGVPPLRDWKAALRSYLTGED